MVRRIFAITTYHEPGERASVAAEEWRRLGVCAIGWSDINFCLCKDKDHVIKRLREKNYDIRGAEDIWRFLKEISEDDLILAYSRDNTIAYVGVVKGPIEYNRTNSIGDPNGEFDYAHQRKVEWWDEPHHLIAMICPSTLQPNLENEALLLRKSTQAQKALKVSSI